MKKTAFVIISIVSVTTFQACKDDHEETPPVITINTPILDAEYDQNDTVFVTGNISHTAAMHEYKIELKNTDNDSVVYTNTTHAHDMNINFSEYWVNTMPDHAQMLLTVTAEDHDGNQSTKTVDFHCHPM